MARYPVIIQLLFSKPCRSSVMPVRAELTIVTSKLERKNPIKSLIYRQLSLSNPWWHLTEHIPCGGKHQSPSCRVNNFISWGWCSLCRPLFLAESPSAAFASFVRGRLCELDVARHGCRPLNDGCGSRVGEDWSDSHCCKKVLNVTTVYVGPSPAYLHPRGFMWNAGDARWQNVEYLHA